MRPSLRLLARLAYEEAFDNFCWEEHHDLEIDELLCAEREKLLDARACAMARARQPPQPEEPEQSSQWDYIYVLCGLV